MTTKFTLRDFLVYFTTGSLFLVCIELIFFDEILRVSSEFFSKYLFIKEFSGLIIVIAIPIIYLIVHVIHSLGILSLWIYKEIHSKLTKWKLRKWKAIEYLRIILHFFMYKNKVVNSVIQENKKNSTWKSTDDFWTVCAKLQIEKKFGPAEYWYTLNDLFKGLYTSFLISTILSCFTGNYMLGVIFCILMFVSHIRAIHFGNSFVITVKRLTDEKNHESPTKNKRH